MVHQILEPPQTAQSNILEPPDLLFKLLNSADLYNTQHGKRYPIQLYGDVRDAGTRTHQSRMRSTKQPTRSRETWVRALPLSRSHMQAGAPSATSALGLLTLYLAVFTRTPMTCISVDSSLAAGGHVAQGYIASMAGIDGTQVARRPWFGY